MNMIEISEQPRIVECTCEGRQCVRIEDRVDMRVLDSNGGLLRTEEMAPEFLNNCIIARLCSEQLPETDAREEELRVLVGDF